MHFVTKSKKEYVLNEHKQCYSVYSFKQNKKI